MPREVPDHENVSMNVVSEAMSKVTENAADQLRETMTMILGSISKGRMPRDIFEIKPETIEYFYSQAYMLYNQGKYKESLYIFQVLVLLDPRQPRHALGSAACLHRLGKYEAAGQVYILASNLDPTNPLPFFHAADCYVKLDAHEIAEVYLKKALEICGTNPKFTLIHERSLLMLDNCRHEIDHPERRIKKIKEEEEKAKAKAAEKENT